MKPNSMGREYAVYSDCDAASVPVEMYSIEKQKDRLLASAATSSVDMAKAAILDAPKTLPFFAERYNISAKIEDYILVPVVMMPSVLPNRNCVGFPYEELASANPDTGCLGFQTWKNKPTHIDHVNKDYTKAKGIIFETAFRRLSGAKGNLWKVMCLAGFDRSRDPVLANAILTGERRAYSMGAWTSRFTCSICGCEANKKTCDHINFKQPRMTIQANGQLAYLQARDITGFELSSVVMPAYASAVTDQIMTWEKNE
jgi:hypothetical protein